MVNKQPVEKKKLPPEDTTPSVVEPTQTSDRICDSCIRFIVGHIVKTVVGVSATEVRNYHFCSEECQAIWKAKRAPPPSREYLQ